MSKIKLGRNSAKTISIIVTYTYLFCSTASYDRTFNLTHTITLKQANIINKITGSFYFTVLNLQVVIKSEALHDKSSLQDVKLWKRFFTQYKGDILLEAM